jgi:alanyl-tRNA synthetase
MITAKELRQKYLDFFKSKGHSIIPSASLIPENDPTVLFTTAGMHPLVPYLMGEKHPAGNRLANVQKCIRTQDIEEVGDKTHDTFFEMLGNWSIGDPEKPDGIGAGYFKKEAIEMSWQFLTSKDWLSLDPKKLAISVFAGDDDAPRDEESANIWKGLGVPEHKIAYLGKADNWWGPAGQTGPCGPDTEMFYWSGETEFPPEKSNPGSDPDNWLEIWNDVFMQYNKKSDGSFEPLKQKNVDTGMGVERTLVAFNGLADVFQIDTFKPLIEKIEKLTGKKYLADEESTKSMRIVADHIRTAVMIMGDDSSIAPSNVDQGYVVRRLLRRVIRHGKLLDIKNEFTFQIAESVIEVFRDTYPEVDRNKSFILKNLSQEEKQFSEVISKGIKEFERISGKLENKVIEGIDAFNLFATYGFPLEMTKELAEEKNMRVDEESFLAEFKKHQNLSRAGAEQKFKGGLADHSEATTKLHTATHLLHAALRKVLGDHIAQKGSNITKERLRFDFSHDKKMTSDELKLTEDLVNQAIQKDYEVTWQEMTVQAAKEKGAIGLFEEKYDTKVKVYSIGNPDEVPQANIEALTFSREICGGPHVTRTSLIGQFKITKEEAVSAGVRRIKAIIK